MGAMQIRARAETAVKRLIRRRLRRGRFAVETFAVGRPASDAQPVLMALWNRPGRLEDMMRMLDEQVDVPGGIELHLWNNNKLDHEHYREVLRRTRTTGALRAVHLTRTPYNVGSIGRFFLARRIAEARGAVPVIVIDDDENIETTFVATARAHYEPRTVTAWWAFFVKNGYHDRAHAEPGGRVDHVGPGGSILNAEFFLDDGFFDDLPDRYLFLDDVWLTWWAKTHGYALAKLPVQIEMVMDETNQYHGLATLKEEFFDRLYPELASGRPS